MTNSTGQGGSVPSLDDRKKAVRSRALGIMQVCDPAASGLMVGDQVGRHLPLRCVVAGFHPLKRELDLRPLLRFLMEEGVVVALPRTPPRGHPLAFHRWTDGAALYRERFGTMTSDGPVVEPDVLLVPLLAFDRRGYRLGYGGGYYDRTIAARPAIHTIGCAYAALEVAEVPVGPHDQALDAIATETEFVIIKASISKAGPCASCS